MTYWACPKSEHRWNTHSGPGTCQEKVGNTHPVCAECGEWDVPTRKTIRGYRVHKGECGGKVIYRRPTCGEAFQQFNGDGD